MKEPQKNPKVWLVRAGKHGLDEDAALSGGMAIIGFSEVGDGKSLTTPEAIVAELMRLDPTQPVARARTLAGQFHAFRNTIEAGDIIVLPLKIRAGKVALGTVAGPYRYQKVGDEMRHTRKVLWVRPDVPRSAFQQDLLYSLGAFMTVCRVTRHDAEHRIGVILKGGQDPGYEEEPASENGPDLVAPAQIELEQAASDEIISYIRAHFPGHDLARLVEGILLAEGFITRRATPGPDGGADILAGRGPLGLDEPTICVQVKATEASADVNIFRALQGTMSSMKAKQGLLVCWGGFTQPTRNEARQHSFTIKLWDQGDLVQAVFRTYEKLSPEIQAELPMKKVWVLVREATEE